MGELNDFRLIASRDGREKIQPFNNSALSSVITTDLKLDTFVTVFIESTPISKVQVKQTGCDDESPHPAKQI
jgi:hypothetical protein